MQYTIEEIKEKLATNELWLYRGIIAIYENQTIEEQSSEATLYNNGVGFNGVDAPFLSSLAEQLLNKSNNKKEFIREGMLSEKQIACARKVMPKYAQQLLNKVVKVNIPVETKPIEIKPVENKHYSPNSIEGLLEQIKTQVNGG